MAKFHHAHKSSTILVVDADALMLTAIGGVLDMQGHRVTLARSESVAAKALAGQQIDLIVLAIDAIAAGCDFAARLRGESTTREIPIIFIVPELTAASQSKLQAQGGVYCVLRSVDPHHLIDLVEKALWLPHVAQRHAALPQPHLQANHDWVRLE